VKLQNTQISEGTTLVDVQMVDGRPLVIWCTTVESWYM
jgi:hypothetical protein